MPPVISALLALISSLLRSRWALHLQVLALQHQVAVHKQTVLRPRLSPTDRVFWSRLSCLWAGWQDCWHSSNLVRSLHGNARGFVTVGEA
jgi:hypothetical protein